MDFEVLDTLLVHVENSELVEIVGGLQSSHNLDFHQVLIW